MYLIPSWPGDHFLPGSLSMCFMFVLVHILSVIWVTCIWYETWSTNIASAFLHLSNLCFIIFWLGGLLFYFCCYSGNAIALLSFGRFGSNYVIYEEVAFSELEKFFHENQDLSLLYIIFCCGKFSELDYIWSENALFLYDSLLVLIT